MEIIEYKSPEHPDNKTKTCSKCKKRKSIEEFSRDTYTKDGFRHCCKQCIKTYRDLHKKEIKEYYNKYKKEIKKYKRKNHKKYRLTPNCIYSILRYNAKHRNIKFNITKIDFIAWYNKKEKKCYYCKRTLLEIKEDKRELNKFKNRLTIDRKNNKIGYTLDNMVLACHRCNAIKGYYFTEQEMLILSKIINKQIG